MATELPLLLLGAGLVLVVMEALAPGAHLAVIGIALLVAGALGVLFTPLASPIALAAMTLVVGAVTMYAYRNLDLYGGKGQEQTSDSDSLAGTFGVVTETVTERSGEVKLDDGGFSPHYQARSITGEIPVGTEIIVVDPGGGNVLTVDAVEDVDMDDIDRELARGREEAADGGEPVDAARNAEREKVTDGDRE